jgi:Tol biopolymer transport system component
MGKRPAGIRKKAPFERIAPVLAFAVVAASFPVGTKAADGESPVLAAKEGGEGTDPVIPRFVRPLGGHVAESNDGNPVWSPGGTYIAFERSAGDGREIVIARPDGSVVRTVLLSGGEEAPPPFLFPDGEERKSYSSGISWSPGGDRFVFMSNGGEGNYDLYLGGRDGAVTRLTEHKEKDGHAHWSPAHDNLLVFVSGRTGEGDVFLLNVRTRELTRLTEGTGECLYPRWSPDGKRVAVMCGGNENHDIFVIGDVSRPAETTKALTGWKWDDIRPAWSPDGAKIAFYTNFDPASGPGSWSIAVVDSGGTPSREGGPPAPRIVATDVVPDVETGPSWMPDGAGIVFVRNDRKEYNPIFIADVSTGVVRPVETETKMNHDVACSPEGIVAFRAQVDQWDRIFIARLGKRAPYR